MKPFLTFMAHVHHVVSELLQWLRTALPSSVFAPCAHGLHLPDATASQEWQLENFSTTLSGLEELRVGAQDVHGSNIKTILIWKRL